MAEFVLNRDQWPSLPAQHRAFLETAIPWLQGDPRLIGLAAGGSFITGKLDEHSDLDLIVVTHAHVVKEVLCTSSELAGDLGPLLAAFPGDHVGEPRLLICLYGPPLLHVDLKFLSVDDLAHRVEDPTVLWDRNGDVAVGLARGRAEYPQPDFQWIEDRVWVWVHYTITKIARGELFEALDALAVIRRRVLGPLILLAADARPDGVRRLEAVAPALVPKLSSAVGTYDPATCRHALEAGIELYTELREQLAPFNLLRRADAERAARVFLKDELR